MLLPCRREESMWGLTCRILSGCRCELLSTEMDMRPQLRVGERLFGTTGMEGAVTRIDGVEQEKLGEGNGVLADSKVG